MSGLRKGNTAGSNQGTAMGAAFEAAQQQQNEQQSYAEVPMVDLFGVASFGQVSNNWQQDQRYEEYAKFLSEKAPIVQQLRPGIKLNVHELRRDSSGLFYSMFAVAVSVAAAPERGVAYHLLIDAGTGKRPLEVREHTLNLGGVNDTLLLPEVPSEVMDDKLAAIVREWMGSLYGGVSHYYCDSTILPSSMPTEIEAYMGNALLNAMNACCVELQFRAGGADINLGHLANEAMLHQNMQFTRQTLMDAVGQPVRSDILIEISARPRRNNNENRYQGLNHSDQKKLASVSGFVELVYNPIQQNMHYALPGQMIDRRMFSPLLVMTDMSMDIMPTAGAVELALVGMLQLRQGHSWLAAVRSTANRRGGVDYHDIGALNIEANIAGDPGAYGEPINTDSAEFNDQMLVTLISSTIRLEETHLAIDVPQMAPQSHYLRLFSDCWQDGNQPESRAYQRLIRAANILTNNEFNRFFPAGTPIVLKGMAYLGGTYIDQAGQTRDLRELDYLAVANIVGKKNPALLRTWTDTWLKESDDAQKRLSDRLKLLLTLTNDQAVVTHRGDRLVINNQFLMALEQALHAAKVQITQSKASDVNFNDQRATASWMSGGMQLGTASPLVSMGYGNGQVLYQNHAGALSRF